MAVKVRFVEERWVKRNGVAEKVKLDTPYLAVLVDYKGQRQFMKCKSKRHAGKKAEEIENGILREEWSTPQDDPGRATHRRGLRVALE